MTECIILSFPMLLIILGGIFEILHILEISLSEDGFSWNALIRLIGYVLVPASVFLLPFIFYSVLKNKYNFEKSIFFYGAGFISCCTILIMVIQELIHGLEWENIGNYSYAPYIFSFTLLYYSYAVLSQNKETVYLPTTTIISFIILIIFETVKYKLPVAGVFLSVFGLHLIYCLIREKGVLNLRGLAWLLFLPSSVGFLYTSVYGFLAYIIIMMLFGGIISNIIR